MSTHHLRSIRQAAHSIDRLTMGQIETLVSMLKAGDLIHVDDVPEYVARVRTTDDPAFCAPVLPVAAE